MPRIVIERAFGSYLLARQVSDEEDQDEAFELTSDELADYEESARKWAHWHRRLSELDNI